MASGLQDIFEGEHIIGRIYVYGNLYFISYYFSLSFFFSFGFFFWKLTYGRYPEELTYPQHVFTLPAPLFFFSIFVLVVVGACKHFVYLLWIYIF